MKRKSNSEVKSNNSKEKKDKSSLTTYVMILITLIIIIIILLLRSCGNDKGGNGSDENKPELPGFEETVEIEDGYTPGSGKIKEESDMGEGIAINVYQTTYIREGHDSIELINSSDNTVNMVYTITLEDGTELVKTGLIAPGSKADKELLSLLDKGEYDVTLTIQTYDVSTNEPCNGANQHVKIIVDK